MPNESRTRSNTGDASGQFAGPSVQVVVVEGPARGMVLDLGQPAVHIGRQEGNDLVLRSDRSLVSAKHARIHHEQQSYYLEDLGSKNKTLLNGRLLEPHRRHLLCHGDSIVIGGEYVLLFRQQGSGAGSGLSAIQLDQDRIREDVEALFRELGRIRLP